MAQQCLHNTEAGEDSTANQHFIILYSVLGLAAILPIVPFIGHFMLNMPLSLTDDSQNMTSNVIGC